MAKAKNTKASGKAVIAAVTRGDHASLKRLLKEGAPVEARDPMRRATALLHAVRMRDATAVKLLVDAAADINAQDNIKDLPRIDAVHVVQPAMKAIYPHCTGPSA